MDLAKKADQIRVKYVLRCTKLIDFMLHLRYDAPSVDKHMS